MFKTKGGAAAATILLSLLATPAQAQSPPGEQPAPTLIPTPGGGTPPPSPSASPAPVTPQPAPATPAPAAWKAPSKTPKLPPPPPPPDAAARLIIVAPGPREAWTMRIDNEGTQAIRIPADIRLLSFEIDVPSKDPKNPKKKPTTYKCAAPDTLRPGGFPESRALLLAPGQSYVEPFDPRLFCFGKNAAALVGSAVVRTRFGWSPPPKWSIAAKKTPTGPFAAEGTLSPATVTPLKQLQAPTLVLSFGSPQPASQPAAPSSTPPAQTSPGATTTPPGAQGQLPQPESAQPASASASPSTTPSAPLAASPGSTPASASATPSATPSAPPAAPATEGAKTDSPPPPKPAPAPPPVDQNAPRLAVDMAPYSDASAPRTAQVTVSVKNAGGRSMTAALRPRMIALDVIGPDRRMSCAASPPTNAVPREGYREYKPGGSTSFTLLIEEACSDRVFTRPGLYQISATVHANEAGASVNIEAFTGKASALEPTLLRLQSSREPFYRDPPKAVPTPGLAAPDSESADGEGPPKAADLAPQPAPSAP